MASPGNHTPMDYKFEKNNNEHVLSNDITEHEVDDLDCLIGAINKSPKKDISKSFKNSTSEKYTECKNNNSDLTLKLDMDDPCSDRKGIIAIYEDFNSNNDRENSKECGGNSYHCKLELKECGFQPIPEDLTNNEEEIRSDDPNISVNCFIQHVSDKTPCRDTNKINSFKQGVTCTSTPLHQHDYKNQIKNEIENLSVIKEEEEENDESQDSQITLKPNEVVSDKNSSGFLRNSMIDNFEQDVLNTPESISDLSVLIKDELSLLIDLPHETLLKETKVNLDEQNLILPFKSTEAVYKTILDKTLNDIFKHSAELAAVKELNIFDTVSDRNEILKKASALQDFISTNEEENKDNNDPEWDFLKKLETDDERYKAVRKLWRNLGIPNLKQNLSIFNWRSKNSLPALKNITPIKQKDVLKTKTNFTYNCTELFEEGKRNLHRFYNRQVQGLALNSDYDTSIMASLNKKPRLENINHQVPLRNNQAEIGKLLCCVQERLLRHDEAIEEIKELHKFYNGLKNQGNEGYGNIMLMSQGERQAILDTENMISQYASWYRDQS